MKNRIIAAAIAAIACCSSVSAFADARPMASAVERVPASPAAVEPIVDIPDNIEPNGAHTPGAISGVRWFSVCDFWMNVC